MRSSILALALCSSTLLLMMMASTATAARETVFDIYGHALSPQNTYFVIPADTNEPGQGALTVATGKTLCPFDVIQKHYDQQGVNPLIFSPVSGESIVYTSTDININFTTTPSTCVQPKVWKVANYDKSIGQWPITLDGEAGKPGASTLQDWFSFEKTDKGYKIRHCPSVCPQCIHLCSDVG